MTIHQPAKDEFEKFNLCFIMGYGGIPTYFGPTGEQAYRFFGSHPGERRTRPHKARRQPARHVRHAQRARAGVHEEHEAVRPERHAQPRAARGGEAWRAEFFRNENPVFQQMYSGRRAIGTGPGARGVPGRADVALFAQLRLLLSRYWKVKMRDRAGAAIMFLQAPIIGVLLAFVFAGQTEGGPVLVPRRAAGAVGQEHEPELHDGPAQLDAADDRPHRGDVLRRRELRLVRDEQRGARDRHRAGDLPARADGQPAPRQLRALEVHHPEPRLRHPVHVLLGIVFFTLGFNGGPVAFLLELAT